MPSNQQLKYTAENTFLKGLKLEHLSLYHTISPCAHTDFDFDFIFLKGS